MVFPFQADVVDELKRALSVSSLSGMEEYSLVALMRRCAHSPEILYHFRNTFKIMFDETYAIMNLGYMLRLGIEFSKSKDLMSQWLKHPSERDAYWVNDLLIKSESPNVIVEVIVSRSPEELFALRNAYYAIFDLSLEEEIYERIPTDLANFLVILLGVHRYRGRHWNEELARHDVEVLHSAIQGDDSVNPLVNTEVLMILRVRSLVQLRFTFNMYKDVYMNSIEEDYADVSYLVDAIQIIHWPPTYFCKVLHNALKDTTNSNSIKVLTRVVISQSFVDMLLIKEEYWKDYGSELKDDIKKSTRGLFRDGILSLLEGNGDGLSSDVETSASSSLPLA